MKFLARLMSKQLLTAGKVTARLPKSSVKPEHDVCLDTVKMFNQHYKWMLHYKIRYFVIILLLLVHHYITLIVDQLTLH